MRRTYVILNPCDDYAAHIIHLVYLKYGLRPLCVYTDRKAAFYLKPGYPILSSEAVEAEFVVEEAALPAWVAEIRGRYRVLGVVPCNERWVEPAARLSDLLRLDWMSTEVLGRFRDKVRMKAFLRERAPHLRVPRSIPVRAPAEVLASGPARAIREASDRFVLKPNDGAGGKNVVILPGGVAEEVVAAHMSLAPGQLWAMEEFVGGPEYAVNGQVGPDGRGVVLVVTGYSRVQVNGRDVVADKDFKVDQTDPVFAPVSSYALSVVSALGLRRSPFHMEVKVDAAGPCLIDLGARLVGSGCAFLGSLLHPGRPDLVELAAHGYLFSDRYGLDEPVDWTWYNAHGYVCMSGIAERDEVITTLDGVDEVEALPQFFRWAVRPRIGQRVQRTLDLYTAPWDLDLFGEGSMTDLLALADQVRGTIRWNQRRATVRERMVAHGRRLADRAVPKLRWVAHRGGVPGFR